MKTEVVKIDPINPEFEIIKKAADYIRQGKLVAIPTETVYGLAAASNNKEAVQKLYEIKRRPQDKPFSIAVGDKDALERLSVDARPLAYKLVDKFWPGPLTLVLKSRENKIGLRMPDNVVTLNMLKSLGGDIVLPSANISGENPPLDANEVYKNLGGMIDLIIDAGKAQLGIESTVVDLTVEPFIVLRQGAIKKEEIEKAAKLKKILFVCTGNSCRSVMAEGLLNKLLKERNRSDVEVISAGVSALIGLPATEETLSLLSKEGIDMSAHRAKRIDNIMLKSSDLILAMEEIQESYILGLAPAVKNRLYLLKEFAKIQDIDLRINDPIGQGRDYYEKIFYSIKECVEKIVELL